MKSTQVLLWFALVQSLVVSQPALADWSSDFRIGAKYSGIVDIGQLGSRKQLVLPPNVGEWKLLDAVRSEFATKAAGRDTNRLVDLAYGNLVFANLANDRQAAVLLWASASLETTSGAILPEVCVQKKDVVFQDLYPSFSSRRKPKCLTIEQVALSSLSDLERTTLARHGISFTGDSLLRVIIATSDNRYGTLALTLTTAAPNGLPDYFGIVKKWANEYIESQLEDSLSRSLEEPVHKQPFPVAAGVAGATAGPTHSVGNVQNHAAQPASNNAESVLDTIERLKALMDKGVISEQEFNAKKAELLKRL